MSAFQPGDLIGGRYRLSKIIGAGAMGTVWSARNESTDRDFALKLMLPDAAKNPVALQRFFQEAKASGRLRHRCIVEVYDLGRIDSSDANAGTPYLVMELLEGEPLDSLLRRKKTLPVGTALRLVRDLARALDVAHTQHIVHRDLKPANVYLHQSLEGSIVPKILDFGVSKLLGPANFDPIATGEGTVLGSPAYMSPEQASGDADVDGRSDVWSLGVILYKCLVGTVPFQAPNYNALMMAIACSAHAPLEGRVEGLPREIDALVDRCLAKERSKRFESARALADEIDRLLDALPALPTVVLGELVTHATGLPSEQTRTVATVAERTGGTLAATELEGPSAPASAPARRGSGESVDPSLPEVRAKTRRVRVIASVAGALLLGVAIFVARRPTTDAVPTKAQEPASLASTPPPPIETMAVAATALSTSASAAPSPPPSASTTSVKKHVAKPVVKAVPKTPKPAHEGVTGAGF